MEIVTIVEGIAALVAIALSYYYGKNVGVKTTTSAAAGPAAPDAPAATKVAEPVPAPAAPAKNTEGRLPDAKVTVLGIYGDSASAHVPAPSLTCDVNQIPEMFADLQVLATGSGFYSIYMDNEPLKDNQMQNIRARSVGEKIPISYWIPQKHRIPGDHVITIKTGAETTETFGLNDGKVEIPVIFTSQDFGLKFTGQKLSRD